MHLFGIYLKKILKEIYSKYIWIKNMDFNRENKRRREAVVEINESWNVFS